jgi:CDP-glucose 4,6-dehydratase
MNRLIPGTIRSALRNEAPVIRSDGKQIRDYIYVKDGVEAYLLLAEKAESLKLMGQAFNFSYEVQLTALEMVQKVLSLMDRGDLKPQILNIANNEILHQYLSADKAKRILNWKPTHSLDKGLTETIAWYRRYFKADSSTTQDKIRTN